jgi:hypothetical protein
MWKERVRPGAPDPRLAIVLASLLVGITAMGAIRPAFSSAGIDFYQYWVVGKALGRGDVSSIYAHDTRAALGQEFVHRAVSGPSERQRAAALFRRVIEPMSTPFLFTALSPLAVLDYETAFDAFIVLSVAFLFFGILALGQVVGLPLLDRLVMLALLLTAFQPVTSDLLVGNVGQIQLGLVALYLWLSAAPGWRRQIAAGAVLGAATAFKPNVAAMAPLLVASWALDRQWRRAAMQAGGFVAGISAAVLVAAWFFGSLHAWTDWRAAVDGLPPMPVEAGNTSLQEVAGRALGVRLGPWPAVVTFGVALVALWVRSRRTAASPPPATIQRDLPVAAAGLLVFLIGSPLVWLHYLLLAVPPVLILLRSRPRWMWLTLAAFIAIAVDAYGPPAGLTNPAAKCAVIVFGLVALFSLVVADLAAPSAEGLV